MVRMGRWRRGKEGGVWDDFCITDVDFLMYDGRPFGEVVFWGAEFGKGDEGKGNVGRVGEVDLTGFRVRLSREDENHVEDGSKEGEELFVQEL